MCLHFCVYLYCAASCVVNDDDDDDDDDDDNMADYVLAEVSDYAASLL